MVFNVFTWKFVQNSNFLIILGVSKLRKNLFAFFGEESPVFKEIEDTFYEHEKCGINKIQFLYSIYPHMAIQKKLPIKEILKVKWEDEFKFSSIRPLKFIVFSLLKIYENGMRQRNSKRLYTPPSQCTNAQFFQTVGLYEAYYPFIILLYGFGLSTIVVVFEVAQKKLNLIEKLAEMLLFFKKIMK